MHFVELLTTDFPFYYMWKWSQKLIGAMCVAYATCPFCFTPQSWL